MAENTGTSGCGPANKLEIVQILEEAKNRWLRPFEIFEILQNYQYFELTPTPLDKPPSGSLFLYREILRYVGNDCRSWQLDGHSWRKIKYGKTVEESYERLKVGRVDVLHCCCARNEEVENFERRRYWMLDKVYKQPIVLVHYLEDKVQETTDEAVGAYPDVYAFLKEMEELRKQEIASSHKVQETADEAMRANPDVYAFLKEMEELQKQETASSHKVQETADEAVPELSDPLAGLEREELLHRLTSSQKETNDPDIGKAVSVEETSAIEQAVSSLSLGSSGPGNQITASVKQEQEGTSNYSDKGKAFSVEEKSGIEQAVSSISWGLSGPASQLTGSVNQEQEDASNFPNKSKAVSVEENSEIKQEISSISSLGSSGPASQMIGFVMQEQEGTSNYFHKGKAFSVEEKSGIEQAVSSISWGSSGPASQMIGSVKKEQEGTSNYLDKGKTISVEEKSGIEEAVSSISLGSSGPASQMTGSVKQEQEGAFTGSKSNDWFHLDMLKGTPSSPRISEQGKGEAVSEEEKSGARKLVSMSLKMSDYVSQEKVNNDNSMIEKSLTLSGMSEPEKGKSVSVEEKSGIGKVVSMLSEISGPASQVQEYDRTGKLLPINLEKEREQIPSAEENVELWASIIHRRNIAYSEESDPPTPQQEPSIPTVSSSANLNQGEESRPEGQDNTKIGDSKKRKRFSFPWWNKK